MRIVIALGGNALLQRGQPMTAENQRANIRLAAERIANIAPGNQLVIATATGRRWACLPCRTPPMKRSTLTRSTFSVRRPRR